MVVFKYKDLSCIHHLWWGHSDPTRRETQTSLSLSETPAPLGGSQGVLRSERKYNPSTKFMACPGVSSHLSKIRNKSYLEILINDTK